MNVWMLLGALSGGLSVIFGAFGAHALKARLTPEMLAIWKTGVEYQMWHAVALLLVAHGLRVSSPAVVRPLRVSAWAFTLGIMVFSGSLYILALSGVRWLGAITPIGGVSFIVGWAAMAWAATRDRA